MRNQVIVAAFASTMLLAACGSSSDPGGSAADSTSAAVAASTEFNDDDVMFAQMMIPHHEQAVEMSDIALDPTVQAGDKVRELATQIKAAQDPEIAQMTALLSEWGKPLTADDGEDHSSMMKGMLSVEDLDALAARTGTDFDTAWAAAMIAHHEGAVAMAEDVLDGGVNGAIAELARSIVATQQAEIETLRSITG
jgi:uncharacterized protein (DUF305 family)